jgi:DNA (cytosine-5)-methyltransferase 1
MYTVVSLFCGAGGLDYGFHKAGFKVIWATDKDKDSCKTFEKWSKIKVVNADINKLA